MGGTCCCDLPPVPLVSVSTRWRRLLPPLTQSSLIIIRIRAQFCGEKELQSKSVPVDCQPAPTQDGEQNADKWQQSQEVNCDSSRTKKKTNHPETIRRLLWASHLTNMSTRSTCDTPATFRHISQRCKIVIRHLESLATSVDSERQAHEETRQDFLVPSPRRRWHKFICVHYFTLLMWFLQFCSPLY